MILDVHELLIIWGSLVINFFSQAFLKPRSVKKTSSGKLRHRDNCKALVQGEFEEQKLIMARFARDAQKDAAPSEISDFSNISSPPSVYSLSSSSPATSASPPNEASNYSLSSSPATSASPPNEASNGSSPLVRLINWLLLFICYINYGK